MLLTSYALGLCVGVKIPSSTLWGSVMVGVLYAGFGAVRPGV